VKKVYTFVCPVCLKKFTYDELGEPMCTGPSEMRDEHVPTVMRLFCVDKTYIHPQLAEHRAVGPLILSS
jgi:hypothetical protein